MSKQENSKLTLSQHLKVFNEACGWAAVMVMAYIFSHYYQLISTVCGFNDSQMGTLMSIVGTVAFVCYLVGGVVADMIRPKICLNITYIGMVVFSLWACTLPGYGSWCVIAFFFAVFGILLYVSPMLKFIPTLGTREQQGRLFGLFYAESGILSLIIGTIASRVIALFDAATGLRVMFILYAAVMVVSGIIHNFIDKSKKGDTFEKTGSFNFKMIGTVLKNPMMWLIFVMAICTYVPSFMGSSYVQPLMASFFGASSATVALVATWSNYGTMVVLGVLCGVLTDKLGSVVKVILLAEILLLVAASAMLLTPWSPAFLMIVVLACFCLRSVNAIGKPGRNSLISESRVPASARGTATGLMLAVMCLPDAFMYKVCGNILTKYEGTATGYRILLIGMLVMGVIGVIVPVIFQHMSKKAKEQDAKVGAPKDILV